MTHCFYSLTDRYHTWYDCLQSYEVDQNVYSCLSNYMHDNNATLTFILPLCKLVNAQFWHFLTDKSQHYLDCFVEYKVDRIIPYFYQPYWRGNWTFDCMTFFHLWLTHYEWTSLRPLYLIFLITMTIAVLQLYVVQHGLLLFDSSF